MANIAISDLRPAGSELFFDSESYLNDLTDGEMTNTLGASVSLVTSLTITSVNVSVGLCL